MISSDSLQQYVKSELCYSKRTANGNETSNSVANYAVPKLCKAAHRKIKSQMMRAAIASKIYHSTRYIYGFLKKQNSSLNLPF